MTSENGDAKSGSCFSETKTPVSLSQQFRSSIAGVRLLLFLVLLTSSSVDQLAIAEDNSLLQASFDSIKIEDIRQHVNTLASDTFEGRSAGSRGGKAASIYLAHQFRKAELQGIVSATTYFQEFGNEMRNLLGLIPGSDPKLKNEYLVVGAHYDHVGYGNSENSNGPIGFIHNGADDNASGVSALLEIAEAWHVSRERPRRSIIFALWDGEEQGLLGSKYFLEAPVCPIAAMKCAVNMDMVGRVRNDSMEVFGVRTLTGLRRIISEQNQPSKFKLNFLWRIEENSDNYPFYLKRIPFVMPFSGYHSDYHTPADDVDKVNLQGIQRVGKWVYGITRELANREDIPAFRTDCLVETDEHRKAREKLAGKPTVRLPVTWNETDGNPGRVIAQINPKSAAAGVLRTGDRVLRWGKSAIDSSTNLPGLILISSSPVQVVVQRPGSNGPLTLSVPLEGTPVRVGVTWHEDPAESGVVILNYVDLGSPADVAGLKSQDRILRVSGKDFGTGEECRALLLNAQSPVQIDVEREGYVRQLNLTIPEDPAG